MSSRKHKSARKQSRKMLKVQVIRKQTGKQKETLTYLRKFHRFLQNKSFSFLQISIVFQRISLGFSQDGKQCLHSNRNRIFQGVHAESDVYPRCVRKFPAGLNPAETLWTPG